MIALATSSALTGQTLLKIVVGSLVAGLGVTVTFSALIYCVERGSEMRRDARRGPAVAFHAAAVLASAACLAIVALGLLETVTKSG